MEAIRSLIVRSYMRPDGKRLERNEMILIQILSVCSSASIICSTRHKNPVKVSFDTVYNDNANDLKLIMSRIALAGTSAEGTDL